MTPEQKAERIEVLQAEINTAPVAQELKTKYADILDKNYVFKNDDSPKALRKKLISMSVYAHPDKHALAISTDIQSKINELASLLGKSPVSAKVVNSKLDNLRDLLDDYTNNVSAREAEIVKLGGKPKAQAEAEAKAKAEDEVEVLGVVDPNDIEIIAEVVEFNKYLDKYPTASQKALRDSIRGKIERDFWADTTNLKTTLGDEYYAQLKWEEIIPENASSKEIKKILEDLNDMSKPFSKLAKLAERYGKDFDWAKSVVAMQNNALDRIKKGESFSSVIEGLAQDYRDIDLSRGVDEARVQGSGVYRQNYYPDRNPKTPCKKGGQYGVYFERYQELVNSGKELPLPYENAPMTRLERIDSRTIEMVHPKGEYAPHAMKHVEKLHDRLKPIIENVQLGKNLSKTDIDTIQDTIAEIHYCLSHAMPWARGSNGIIDSYMRSLYKAVGLDVPALKENISLDLEAFCTDLDTFKQKWKNWEYFAETAADIDDIAEPVVSNTSTHTPHKAGFGLE